MRLYKYLNESFAEIIQYKLIKQLLEKHCSKNWNDMIKSGVWIRRGDKKLKENKSYLIDPTSQIRASAHTANYYTILFSELLDNWKSYPPRNKSLICTTRKQLMYGKQFYVIPFDNIKIGICPEYDIWYSFKKGLKQLDKDTKNEFGNQLDLSSFNNYIQQYMRIHISELPDAMKKNVKDFSKGIRWQHNKNFKAYLEEILDPAMNGFKTSTSCASLPDNNEIWFSGKCLMINEDMFEMLTE